MDYGVGGSVYIIVLWRERPVHVSVCISACYYKSVGALFLRNTQVDIFTGRQADSLVMPVSRRLRLSPEVRSAREEGLASRGQQTL